MAVKDVPLSSWYPEWLISPGTRLTQREAYAVPWVYRCVTLRAQAIGALPFTIQGPGGGDARFPLVDILPSLLYVTEAALCLYGAAYWYRERNRVRLLNLRFLHPGTIEPRYDQRSGLVGFTRTLGGEQIALGVEDVVYFWQPNPLGEVGPGMAPGQVALTVAGLAKNINEFASAFFQRGAIPAVLLSVEGNPSPEELKRLEAWWKRLLQGVRRAWETIAVRATVKPQIIGSPVKDLAMPELTGSVRQQIAVAFGIPQTLLEDAANYATAREHRLSFYRETILPEAEQIQATLNQQLFGPLGLRFEFQPGQVEALQQDEATKADALVKLFEVGIVTLDEVREQLGFSSSTPRPAPAVQQGEMRAELRRWRDKVRKQGAGAPFVSGTIPAGIKMLVQERLQREGEDAFHFLKDTDTGRLEAEQRLQREIASALSIQWARAGEAVAGGRQFDLDAFASELRNAVDDVLVSIVQEQVLREAVAVGIDFDVARINTAAWEWARQYSYDLVTGLTETTREVVADATAKFVSTPGMTQEELRKLLEPAFGEVRAKMIGITEVTRAYSQATLIYRDLLDGMGVVMRRVWNTSADERVCPICAPLNGRPEGKWGGYEPPAHPNCRCWTTLEYIGRR